MRYREGKFRLADSSGELLWDECRCESDEPDEKRDEDRDKIDSKSDLRPVFSYEISARGSEMN
jgi:hypothetical protein